VFAEGESAASAAGAVLGAGSEISGVGFIASGAVSAAGSGAGCCLGGADVEGAGGASVSSEL
jgi:hypothetical protein